MKIDRVKVGDEIPGCDCKKGEVREIRLTRNRRAYIVVCKCNALYYVSVTGRLE